MAKHKPSTAKRSGNGAKRFKRSRKINRLVAPKQKGK